MAEPHRLSDADREGWAERRFDQEVATARHLRFVSSLSHPPVTIERRVAGELVTDDELLAVEPEITIIPRHEWEGDLPRSAKAMTTKAEKLGYAWRAYGHHGERRGSHGRLLDPPEADYCTVAFVRGEEKFLAMWAEVGGAWKFDTALDYTPTDELLVLPRIVKSTTITKERLQ